MRLKIAAKLTAKLVHISSGVHECVFSKHFIQKIKKQNKTKQTNKQKNVSAPSGCKSKILPRYFALCKMSKKKKKEKRYIKL